MAIMLDPKGTSISLKIKEIKNDLRPLYVYEAE